MVPSKPVAGGRALLPAEVALCETVGITAEEYLYFQQLSDAYNGKRDEAYDLAGVPDIQNPQIAVPIIINIVVGVALAAISMLLAPKPKAAESPGESLRTDDISGPRTFTQGENFDSVQQLAKLGTTIPLVFAHRDRTGKGGVRVSGQLVWSQLLSRGTGQQLKALMVLSMGRLRTIPDFAGYAIGDSSLKNYSPAKVALYFRQGGGRIREGDRTGGGLENGPSDDVFQVRNDGATPGYEPWFSGTRTPSTQTQFGLFAPMGNGVAYKVQYELLMSPKSSSGQTIVDTAFKGAKLSKKFETFQAFIRGNNGQQNIGNTLIYYCGSQVHADAYPPWGVSDVNAALEDRRTEADTTITVGDMYLAGTAAVVCTRQTEGVWVPGKDKEYYFRVVEPGICTLGADTSIHASYDYHLQRLAIGTIANNRACDATEIGIKSTVWRQINFPNVNSQPPALTIAQYNESNTSLQLGNVDRYITRYSFFRLQWREIGVAEGNWNDLSAGGVPFAVRGNAPVAQYNFIRIVHPSRGQYEFRFMPVAGAEAYWTWRNKDVRLIEPTEAPLAFSQDGFFVRTTGRLLTLTDSEASNSDWVIAKGPDAAITKRGPIASLNAYNNTGIPPYIWGNVEGPYYSDTYLVYRYRTGDGINNYSYYWGTTTQEGGVVTDNGPATNNGTQQIVSSLRYLKGNIRQGTEETQEAKYEISRDNLIVGAATSTGKYELFGGTGSGASIEVSIYSNGAAAWVIDSKGSGYSENDTLKCTVPSVGLITLVVTINPIENYKPSVEVFSGNLNPYDAISDYKLYDSEKMSHERSPEHEIVYVNELFQQSTIPNYDNLAMVGVRLNSTKEWSSFQQLSAYVRNGIEVDRLCDDNGIPVNAGILNATQNLPEIAYALLTDKTIGAGNTIGAAAVDRERMQIASRFCYANSFLWDGVITEKLNLRQWIYEMAGFNLLDFTILGGRFSLVPSVPYKSDGTIDYQGKPEIKALFTDGNIRNLKVTWLSPEERQLFKAVVKIREEVNNGFTRDRIVSVRLSDSQGGNELDPEENFDLSAWCCSSTHAEIFAKYALKLRLLVDHGLTFETTPAGALGLSPGEYIRLVSEVTHTSRFNNGSIDDAGTITSTTTLANGSYSILYWEPGTVGVKEATLTVANGVAQSGLRGVVFTLKNSTTTSRVYKVESITVGEEGFVQIAASYQPVNESGQLEVLQWDQGDFVVEAF